MWRLYSSARWRRFIRLCQRGSPANVALPLPPLPTRLSAVQISEREKKESQCRSVLSDGVPENIPRINSHEILEKRKKKLLAPADQNRTSPRDVLHAEYGELVVFSLFFRPPVHALRMSELLCSMLEEGKKKLSADHT